MSEHEAFATRAVNDTFHLTYRDESTRQPVYIEVTPTDPHQLKLFGDALVNQRPFRIEIIGSQVRAVE